VLSKCSWKINRFRISHERRISPSAGGGDDSSHCCHEALESCDKISHPTDATADILINQFDYLLNAEAPATNIEQNKAAAFMVSTTIRIDVDGV
jgi:hypothetical protein